MLRRPVFFAAAAIAGGLLVQAAMPSGGAQAQSANFGNLGGSPGRHGYGDNGGFSFTGPAEFYADGRMTCYRAKAVMRYRLGYSDLVVHNCEGRLYRIEGWRNGARWLVTLDAFSTDPVNTRRLR